MLTTREKFTYSLGSLGREVSNNMINTYFMLYLTMFIGLNGIVVGAAFCVAKIWDAINDPIVGLFVNNTKSKLGKFRPWILAGALLNCIVLVFMFLPVNLGLSGNYVYYIGMYVLWGMTFTMVDVPFWSMIPSIADTTHERNSVSAMAKLIGGFGGFTIGSGGSIIIGLTFGSQNVWSYFVVACVAGVLFVAMLSFTIIGNREKYIINTTDIRFKDIIGVFKENTQLRTYALSYILFIIGTTVSLVQPIYLFIYDKNTLDFEKHFLIFNALSCTGQGIMMIFYPQIVKKIPREKIYGMCYVLAVIGMLSMFGVFFILGANKLVNVIIVSFAGSMLMMANGLNQIGSTVMIADVVDYGEWKTGKRTDSIMFSVQTMLTKFAGAVATLVLGIAVTVAKLPTINPLNNTFTGEVTPEMLTILRAFMFLMPIPFMVAGGIIYRKKYTLYGDYYVKVKNELDLRHAGENEDEEEVLIGG